MISINMQKHIHESNLIEGYDNHEFDNALLDAWEYLLDCPMLDHVSIQVVQEISVTAQNDLPKNGIGFYRNCNVMVGGRLCPAPHLVQELMHNWVMDINEHWQTLDPKQMHIRFEKIHPFIDGNGRTGRLLMWWHELMQGKNPTLILNDTKFSDYYSWFTK